MQDARAFLDSLFTTAVAAAHPAAFLPRLLPEAPTGRVVLLAGGVGITPMMSVIRSLTASKWKGDMYLVFGVRTRDDVIFAEELKSIAAANPNVHVTLHYSSESGHITADVLNKAVPDFTHGPVMMCGPGPMMVAMRPAPKWAQLSSMRLMKVLALLGGVSRPSRKAWT